MPRKWQMVLDPGLPVHPHVIILLSPHMCVQQTHTHKHISIPLYTQNPIESKLLEGKDVILFTDGSQISRTVSGTEYTLNKYFVVVVK